jgi:methionine-rich copper-binding protein CopC
MTRHDPARRFAALLLATGLFVAVGSSVVLGHSELDTPTPADKSTVTEPVVQVSGTFTEAIKTDGSSLIVKDATGATVAQGGVDTTDAKVMTASPAPNVLANGVYTVQWTTVSAADGDVARGTWTFTVAIAPSPSPTATPARSASAAPTAAPTPTPLATLAPSPSGSGSSTGSGGDAILPIIVALIILGAGAAYLLSRRGRPAAGA